MQGFFVARFKNLLINILMSHLILFSNFQLSQTFTYKLLHQTDKFALKLRTDLSHGDPLQCLLKMHFPRPPKILLLTPQTNVS